MEPLAAAGDGIAGNFVEASCGYKSHADEAVADSLASTAAPSLSNSLGGSSLCSDARGQPIAPTPDILRMADCDVDDEEVARVCAGTLPARNGACPSTSPINERVPEFRDRGMSNANVTRASGEYRDCDDEVALVHQRRRSDPPLPESAEGMTELQQVLDLQLEEALDAALGAWQPKQLEAASAAPLFEVDDVEDFALRAPCAGRFPARPDTRMTDVSVQDWDLLHDDEPLHASSVVASLLPGLLLDAEGQN